MVEEILEMYFDKHMKQKDIAKLFVRDKKEGKALPTATETLEGVDEE